MKEVNVKRGESILISTDHITITIRPLKLYTRVHIYTKSEDTLALRVKYKKS